MLTDDDHRHLERCLELAEEALDAGDEPYGSVLVAADGSVLHEDRNRTGAGDGTRHPEFDLARWAGEHLDPAERPGATVYTSGEHCPMCSAAHAFVGLGRIVVASSTAQSAAWAAEEGWPAGPIATLSVLDVVPGHPFDGPSETLAPKVRELLVRWHERHG